MGKLSILAEFWKFIRVRKKYWLAPIVFFLLILGLLIVMIFTRDDNYSSTQKMDDEGYL